MAEEAGSPLSMAPTETQLAEGVLTGNHVMALGREMFGPHLIAVQVGGVLLLAALIGAAAIVAGGQSSEPPNAPPASETEGP
jgi:NADH:ubiquinone oxidoreductase subunit 6 (subunit J)